ncbi:MAG: hypothetical protein ABWY52_00955, partial [Candidatus Limnocylindrales bacterium]
MAVIFLDQDDEITTAIARMRASQDIKVAMVLPPGSRLGTSRINFRLLAREAQELPRQASIVTTEAGVRAIAVSAGLAAYASVAEFEAAAETAAAAVRSDHSSDVPVEAAAATAVGVAGAGAAAGAIGSLTTETTMPGGAEAPAEAEPAAAEPAAAEPAEPVPAT